MLIRKFDRANLDSEPDRVLFRDLYPWDEIEETPFGASLAVIEGGGQTMVHSHHPAETFIICQGQGTMTIGGVSHSVSSGDVIYLPPQSVHNLKNDSPDHSLMFLSVFWNAPTPADEDSEQPQEQPQVARLHYPSPPTPNGGLHLGHLSGPYLMADVARRFDRMRGIAAQFLLVCDDHQSYTELRAEVDGKIPAESASLNSQNILELLKAFEAAPDQVIHPHKDMAYRQAVSDAFRQLVQAGLVKSQATETAYCGSCQRFLYDGHLGGECPHCQASCRGFLCETCCLPNQGHDLKEAYCLHCQNPPEWRPVPRWCFSMEPFREALQDYHQSLRMTPRLRALSCRLMELSLQTVVSQPARWGIEVDMPGFEGQCLSPWFELALAQFYLRGSHTEVAHYFGYDNSFLYLIHDPAVALALKPDTRLPAPLCPNEYLLLDEGKMSTRSGHNLGGEILSQIPSDLLRFYLACHRPEDKDINCSLEHMQRFLENRVIQPWQAWLERVGRALTTEAGSKAPTVTQWTPEQEEFMGQLQGLKNQLRRGYNMARLQEVTRAILELVDRSVAFGSAHLHLLNLPSLVPQRQAALAIELAAVRLLAEGVTPIMPRFAANLWKHLGFRQPEGWSDRVELVPPGQRVLAAAGLAARRYFPPSLSLTPA